MKEIALITTGWFPEGDAGAVRLRMMTKCLADAGYHTTVLCRGEVNSRGTVDGTDYISLRNHSSKVGKLLDYLLFPSKVKRYLNKNKSSLHGVYIYNAKLSVFEFCKGFCKNNNIKLFHDCVEWYSPEEFKNGEKNKSYRAKNKVNTEIVDSTFSVIAISRFLEEHFVSRGINTLRVPILCDSTLRTEPKKSNDEKLTLFYAGLPGGKDLVGNLLKAVLMLDSEEKKKLRIVFVGTTRQYLINSAFVEPDVIDGCEGTLELCGRVPRAEVIRRMEEADFSVLIRDAELRFAKAGFPSKVIEALSNATPMLCNISSDLGEFLVDGENSVIAEDHSPESIAYAIRRALALTPEQKNQMSRNALKTVSEKFDYRIYTEKIGKFFE